MANYIRNVAIVGATGRIGKSFAEALIRTNKHNVTALTRPDSKGTLPTGIKKVEVDYTDETSLVSALRGQQFLAITLSVRTPPETHSAIVKAAVKAGVPYIMPNAYGSDLTNKKLGEEDLYGAGALQRAQEIADLGASYVVLCCGFWYEWSLAIGEQWFGFDIKNKKVTFFDDGNTKINASTWNLCGEAFGALLSLPESGGPPSVEQFKNNMLYIASFRVSQRDMLDSIHRVTGSSDADWTITYEPTAERYRAGKEEMSQGNMLGYAKAMYSRVFYPNGDGDYESRHGLQNDMLGLTKESLDEATKRAVEMALGDWNPFA